MTLDFSDVQLVIAGDVCDDVLLVGAAERMSRETPGLPIISVQDAITIAGGATVALRQAQALQAHATLVPTGPSTTKTRLFAATDDVSREIARFDRPWPRQDPEAFAALMRETRGSTLLYSQVRPDAPLPPIVRLCRSFQGFTIADARHPGWFVGFDVLKVSLDDAWNALQPPRPARTVKRAAETAAAFCETYGYRMAVVTMGAEGYGAAVDGSEIIEAAVAKGRRTAGAGDVFAATLACALAAKHEARDALHLANLAAGLACSKDQHLAITTLEELNDTLD